MKDKHDKYLTWLTNTFCWLHPRANRPILLMENTEFKIYMEARLRRVLIEKEL